MELATQFGSLSVANNGNSSSNNNLSAGGGGRLKSVSCQRLSLYLGHGSLFLLHLQNRIKSARFYDTSKTAIARRAAY
jgi:hypothetical protein